MRRSASILALLFGAACGSGGDGGDGGFSAEPLSLEDELGFRRLRQDLHLAKTIGDPGLTRGLWADDAVLTTRAGTVVVGADSITDFIRSDHIEEAWSVVDPLVQAWENPADPPLHVYEQGSWGPEAADAFIAQPGSCWME